LISARFVPKGGDFEVAKIHPNNPTLHNPKFAKEVFDHARQPAAWFRVARRLRSSADAVFERENPVAERFWTELRRGDARLSNLAVEQDFDEQKYPFPNFNAAYMLVAFAIENLLKGLAIAKGLVTFSDQKLPKELVTHDLDKLHKLVAPKATISQDVLDSLTYVGVAGSLPAPHVCREVLVDARQRCAKGTGV
jgi:hypothetical protein